MIRKEVLIVLITFCLTATLFSIIPVGSQGVREYDPWYDINGDGKIDLKDYYGVGLKYATTGDPTKNVNVTNWPTSNYPKDNDFTWCSGVQAIGRGWFYDRVFNTSGFRQVTVVAYANTSVSVGVIQTLSGGTLSTTVDFDSGYAGPYWAFRRTVNVMAPILDIQAWNHGSSGAYIICWVYMNSIPSIETSPTYSEQTFQMNVSSESSYYTDSYFRCYGYSRLSLGAMAVGRSDYTGTYDVTLYVCTIDWLGHSTENFSPNAFNVTFYMNNGQISYSSPTPFITETKGSTCMIQWTILESHNLPLDWWFMFDVSAYLRSE